MYKLISLSIQYTLKGRSDIAHLKFEKNLVDKLGR
jgi:hypothetical protein